MSPDLPADVASSESLSFAGLVCIQDQCSNPVKEVAKLKKQEPEFEFKYMAQCPNERYEEGEGLFPNGQHLSPEATAVLSNQPRVVKRMELEDFLSPTEGNRRRAEQMNKKPTARKSFSQKLFQSFVKPCNNCRAVQTTPSVKGRALQ